MEDLRKNQILINTKHFGDIYIEDCKILFFENGILGYETCKKYVILYNQEDDKNNRISWLQSIDERDLALPIINPFLIKQDYNPEIEDDLLFNLDDLNDENIIVLVSITVTKNADIITANLKAPFIINTETRKGTQVIAQNSDYEVKFNITEIFKVNMSKKGDE